MKLIPLTDYIDYYVEKCDNDELTKEQAWDEVFYYKRFLDTPLDKDMFIGDKQIFKGNFEESSCWEAGYDNHHYGDFIKLGSFIFNITGDSIADCVKYIDNLELTDYGYKLLFGQREFNLSKLIENV